MAKKTEGRDLESVLKKFDAFADKIQLTRQEALELSAYVLANCLWIHPELETAKKQTFEVIEDMIALKIKDSQHV